MEEGRGEMVSLALGAGEVVSLTPAGGQAGQVFDLLQQIKP